ncbi:MAG: radical SAM protein [Eubacterium sp.]|nr:radical SAM protein [Eubacterium sp.]
MKKGNISIFVPHIGCPQKCSFCNQNTITGSHSAPTPDDVKNAVETALLKTEYEYEIAFFGGSFTAIEKEYMVSLLDAAKPYIESGKIKGIRCSTRPDAIDDEVLSLLKAYGVTAIELGAQSMNDDVLSANLRGHTADDIRNASRLIKEYGFELGLQMMTDLYLSSPELDIETAKEIIKLNPDTVRIYPTVTLKNTYLEKLMNAGKYTPASIDSTISLCAELVPMFNEKGIRIIRLGLHASDDVKENMLGGGYHESLGEMVCSRILLNQILENPPGKYTAYINEKTVSKLKGNKKSNITALQNAGYNIKIIYDNSLSANELRLKNGIKNT